MSAKLVAIMTCAEAGQALERTPQAKLIPSKGIEGDRYFKGQGTFSAALQEKGDFEVTLIAAEEIEAFNRITQLGYAPEQFRRNLLTSGIDLNALVDKRFSVGDVELYGVRLCEPCAYLKQLLGDEVMAHMVHKAGLRAVIKHGGSIMQGDPIAVMAH